MKFRVKSQLTSDQEAIKQGILDDCTWSSCAAVVSYVYAYAPGHDFSAADGVAAQRAVTKRVDVQGKSDNGGSLAEAVKVIAHLGGKARYAKSWEDAVTAAKNGDALLVWVQQPQGFPDIHISEWHDKWKKWWHVKQKQPDRTYGHMTSASYGEFDGVETFQWCCPTRSGKGKEEFAVPVSEAQLRQIANSKVKAGKLKADYKAILIVSNPNKKAVTPALAPVSAPTPAPTPAPAPAPAREDKPVAKAEVQIVDPKVTQAIGDAAARVNWGAVGKGALVAASGALAAASATKGFMNKIGAALKHIANNTQLDEMALDGIRTFVTVTLSTALALGVPLLEVDGPNWKLAISAGLSSAAVILIKAMDPKFTGYGPQEKKQ
jgi:hypothetical protein